MSTKHLHVTCAIIEQDGRALATQRGAAMSHPLLWEFPGGKIKPGESPEACLQREILEELAIHIDVGLALAPTTHHYAAHTVTLYPFLCRITAGEIILHEHAAALWLPAAELPSLAWAEADLPVVAAYCHHHQGSPG